MYAHPFSADYWRDASREVRDLRKLLFSALMIALCIVLAQVLGAAVRRGQGHLGLPGPVRLCLGLRPGAGPAVRLCGGHSSASSSLEEAAIPFSPAIL